MALGYEFLRYHLKVDFTNLVPVTEEARSAEQRAQEERSKQIRRKKYQAATAEIDEQAADIQENVRKMVKKTNRCTMPRECEIIFLTFHFTK